LNNHHAGEKWNTAPTTLNLCLSNLAVANDYGQFLREELKGVQELAKREALANEVQRNLSRGLHTIHINLTTQYITCSHSLHDVNQNLTKAQGEKESLLHEVEVLNSSLSKARDTIQEITESTNTLKIKSALDEQVVLDLKDKLETAKSLAAAKESTIEVMGNQTNLAAAELTNLQENMDSLKIELNMSDTQVMELQQQIDFKQQCFEFLHGLLGVERAVWKQINQTEVHNASDLLKNAYFNINISLSDLNQYAVICKSELRVMRSTKGTSLDHRMIIVAGSSSIGGIIFLIFGCLACCFCRKTKRESDKIFIDDKCFV
jgi:chromosome segregation ATPase